MLVHRRGVLRAEKILQERLFANPKIDVMWNTELDEVLGTDKPLSVTGARLKSTLTGEIVHVPIDGIFIAIGHEPQTRAVQGPARHEALAATSSPRRTRPRPTSPACLPPATSPTTSTARR